MRPPGALLKSDLPADERAVATRSMVLVRAAVTGRGGASLGGRRACRRRVRARERRRPAAVAVESGESARGLWPAGEHGSRRWGTHAPVRDEADEDEDEAEAEVDPSTPLSETGPPAAAMSSSSRRAYSIKALRAEQGDAEVDTTDAGEQLGSMLDDGSLAVDRDGCIDAAEREEALRCALEDAGGGATTTDNSVAGEDDTRGERLDDSA